MEDPIYFEFVKWKVRPRSPRCPDPPAAAAAAAADVDAECDARQVGKAAPRGFWRRLQSKLGAERYWCCWYRMCTT